MEIYSHPDIPEILSLPGNSSCCDCGMERPKWASLNNGIFLCLKCAGIHRSLGVDISTIRSLQIDSWTDKQILYLSQGGNLKFKQNLEEFGIDPKTQVEYKYKCKASDYYRKYLKNLVEKISDQNYKQIELIKPSSEEGRELMDIKKGNDDVNNVNIIGDFKEQKKDEGFFGAIGSFFNNVKKQATEAAGKISKEFDELKIGDKLKEAGDKIADNAKIAGNYLKDKSQKALNSDFVKGITNKAESGINVVIEKTKVLLKKNENQNQPQNEQSVNLIIGNNKDNNNINNDNAQNIGQNEKEKIQMSNVINNDNINNININENKDNNEIINGGNNKKEEIKEEEVKKEEEGKNEEKPKEEKVEEKKEEENKENENIDNNDNIGNKKIEEENVKHEPENPQGP